MSGARNPAAILFDPFGNPILPTDATQERIAKCLDAILEATIQNGSTRQITDYSRTPVAVKQARSRAQLTDPSLVTQLSPVQQPVPMQAAPQGATPYVYSGYASPGTSLQFVGGPENEIFSNTTTPSVISASANDAIGGTGVKQVIIEYFDQNLVGPWFVTVNMNGVTAVNLGTAANPLPSPMCYIENIYGISAGTVFAAAGNIVLWSGATATGTQMGQINSGDSQSFWCRHYIPAGVTSYITGMGCSLGSAGIINAFIGATPNFNSTGQFNIGMETNLTGYLGTGGGGFMYNFPTPIAVPGPGRFYMQAIASIATGLMYGMMNFYDAQTSARDMPGNPILPGNPMLPSPPQIR